MKKVITMSSVLLGVVFLAGCGQQQLEQKSSIKPAPENQQQNISTPDNQQTASQQVTKIQIDSNMADWPTYSSNNLKIRFKYPKNWYIKEEKELGNGYRIYIRNVQDDLYKDELPPDFQQVWISTWEQEANAQTENDVKAGKPYGMEFEGTPSISIGKIDRDNFVINTYEFKPFGGSVLQAFWKDGNGKRYYATNSTEIDDSNQQQMIKNLKKILATIQFIK